MMGLTFINPYFLFGLAAGILPILIHRLIQTKAIPRTFSAVRLLQSQTMMARPERLKHRLLLCLRVLAVMSLVVLGARPVLTRQGLLVSGSGGATVIVLDNSPSMAYREGGEEERFRIAKRAAEEVIKGLKGRVCLLPTVPTLRESGSTEEFRWMTPEEALKALSSTSLSFGRGDPVPALNKAHGALKGVKKGGEILIITDLTRGDWEGFDLSKPRISSSEVSTTFLRIGGERRDPNLGIKKVELVEGEGVVGVTDRLEVTVSNRSDLSRSTLVQLFLSGIKTDQKSIDLRGGEEGKVSFELVLEKPGWFNGEVRLSGDWLSTDDVFHFPLKVKERPRVLIVDGDPRASSRSTESFYLVQALQPGGLDRSPFVTRVITEEGMADADSTSYEALFLLNVSRPQPSRISSFLQSSKPIFIFLGDRVVSEAYHHLPLFPCSIKEVVDRPAKIVKVDERHGALKFFSGPEGGSLRKASIWRYLKIGGARRSLLSLENGDPLLVEADWGGGKLFLFASTADLDWNDLPLKAAYLPLIHGLLKEATGLLKTSLPAGMRWGQTIEEKALFHQVTGSQGGPGIYRFLSPSGEVRRALNMPPEESDLGKVSETEVKKKFGTREVKVVQYGEGIRERLHGGREEVWPFVFGFLLLFLVLEMVVASRI